MYWYDFEFLLFLIGGAVLLAPVLAIVALVKISNLRYDIARLSRAVRALEQRTVSTEPPADARPERPPETPPAATPPVMPERTSQPARSEEPPEAATPETAGATPPPAEPPPSRKGPFPPQGPKPPEQGLEERFATRWLVILAGIAGFLAAIYLYDYSVEMGWLGPAGQCILGALCGFALILGGEGLRRHPWERAAAIVKPSLIPAAAVSVGVAFLYVSAYAAYALFDLLAPLVAFVLMGGVWALAIGLSLVYGPFVAALGILGGFLVPILVQTGHPSAYGLFPYLAGVNIAALGVLRYKGWGWLAWWTFAGAAIWPFLWMAELPGELGAPAVGAYLTVTALLFIYIPAGLAPHRAPLTLTHHFRAMPHPAILAWAAGAAMLLLTLMLVWSDDFGTGSVVWAGILGAALMFAGRRDETYDALPVGGVIMAAVVLLTWDLPGWPGEVDPLGTIPPGLESFVLAAAGFALLYGIAGFGLLRGAARPGLWAALSAITPTVVLAVAFWRIKGFELDYGWSVMGLVLGALNLGAAISIARGAEPRPGALAAYAVGVVAAVTLAMTMALENAWLTVALSLQLPALAWIHDRTRVDALRAVALILASTIFVRLVFNYQVFDYALGAVPGLNWMLYGYGIPTMAFYAAARMFRRHTDDRLVIALESGALVFLTLFCTLEIADIVQGGQFLPGDSLLEASLRSIAWLTIATALLYQCRARPPRLVAFWGWQILAVISGGHIATIHLVALNPLLTGASVGTWWIADILTLAYAAPAAFAVVIRVEAERQKHLTAPALAGVGALFLVFVWITLEVRHFFHAPRLDLGATTDAEWWAYSIAWLLYAVALLFGGVRTGSARMRYASSVLVVLTVVKTLFDISEMRGLWLVASLFGLMLFVLGIAWVYRRYVFPPKPPAAAT